MGFSESFVSMEQSRSDQKRGLRFVLNSLCYVYNHSHVSMALYICLTKDSITVVCRNITHTGKNNYSFAMLLSDA